MKLTARRQVLWAVLGLLAIVIALLYTNQQSGRLELGGKFEGEAISAIVTQISPNEYRADLTTARRCKGEVSVFGRRYENMVRFSPLLAGGMASECVIEAKWSEKGRIVTFKEEKCEGLHRLACSVDGKMNRIGRAKIGAKPVSSKKRVQ